MVVQSLGIAGQDQIDVFEPEVGIVIVVEYGIVVRPDGQTSTYDVTTTVVVISAGGDEGTVCAKVVTVSYVAVNVVGVHPVLKVVVGKKDIGEMTPWLVDETVLFLLQVFEPLNEPARTVELVVCKVAVVIHVVVTGLKGVEDGAAQIPLTMPDLTA